MTFEDLQLQFHRLSGIKAIEEEFRIRLMSRKIKHETHQYRLGP